MKEIVIDTETDHVEPEKVTRIHVLVAREPSGRIVTMTDHERMRRYLEENSDALFIAHNMCGYDFHVIRNILGLSLVNLADTFIISRMVNFNKFNTHSLEEIGDFIGERKLDYDEGFDTLSDKMIEYCIQDVNVTERFWKLVRDFFYRYRKAVETEQHSGLLCHEIHRNGFCLDVPAARKLLEELEDRARNIEEDIRKAMGLQKVLVTKLKYRKKKDGTLFGSVEKARERYDLTVRKGSDLWCYNFTEFDIRSRKMVIDALWDAGWKPVSRTLTHKKTRHPDRRLKRYGWKLDETNLATVPEEAAAMQRVVEWLTIDGRIKNLRTWLEAVREDGRIHPALFTIGCWSHRVSHSKPNVANIASVFHGKPRNASEVVKKEYDWRLRSLWKAGEGKVLVGVDADGIQLRVLAHEMLKHDDSESTVRFARSIETGSKENGTDIHNLNKKLLGDVCRDRDTAKTFIYAFLLGASVAKISEILDCSREDAATATKKFLEKLPGLYILKNKVIPEDVSRGYLFGLDGRPVRVTSAHLGLVGYLQSGEAIVMKTAGRIWKERFDRDGTPYRIVNFVHDEWQTETRKDHADVVGKTQVMALREAGKLLGMNIAIEGEYKTGTNWMETH